MGLFDRLSAVFTPPQQAEKPAKNAQMITQSGAIGRRTGYYTHTYNGEKNLGEMGPVRVYALDYDKLRFRSWQAMLESDVAQIVVGKFVTWVVGVGLKLQSEPKIEVLESEGVTLDIEKFSKLVEARWDTWSKSNESDYTGMKTKNALSAVAYKNAIVGGDVLMVMRYEKENVSIQLIDGQHLGSPAGENEYNTIAKAEGNYISNGIEKNQRGEHIAFYVRKVGTLNEYDRIPAKGKSSGLVMAKLIYGLEYRLDNDRGMPFIAVVLETAKKMERYKEATLGSAEERQKIAYTIEHALGSTGEDPRGSALSRTLARAIGNDSDDDIPVTNDGEVLADKVAATFNKQTINMPINATLKSLESKNELYFKEFYDVNMDYVCAALGIPPNVAMSKFDANFSASRAALKDWEHTLTVRRSEFSCQFDQVIYNFWLEIEILRNKIQAPGYLVARKSNFMLITGYRNARFVGANVPHIDPVKEVTAERLKLGATGASIPLTTVEAATEALNGGYSDSNFGQYAKELQKSKDLGIEIVVPETEPVKEEEV